MSEYVFDREIAGAREGTLKLTLFQYCLHLLPGILQSPLVIDIPLSIRKQRKDGMASLWVHWDGPVDQVDCGTIIAV